MQRLPYCHAKEIIIACALGMITGCSTIQISEPIRAEAAAKGITIMRELPSSLPRQTSRIPDTQYLLVYAQSGVIAAAQLANPIPFVADIAAGAYEDQKAQQLKDLYASVDPYAIAVDRLRGSYLLSGRSDALHMMPLVYLVEGSDDRVRPTLIFRVEGDGWLGRYMYHLPTTYSSEELKNAAPAVLASLRKDLIAGADMLRRLMERDARGELKKEGRKVTYGSLYLVGSNSLGLIPATISQYPDSDLIEEGPDYVVLRSKGISLAGAREGALAFGVHYFLRDQLHTLKPKNDEQK